MVFVSILDSISSKIRPVNELGLYSDLPRSKKRRLTFCFTLLVFLLVCFGYLFYKIVNPSLVAKDEKDDLSPTRIRELFNLWDEDEIEDLKCPCNKYPKLVEIDLEISIDAYAKIEQVCLDVTPNTQLSSDLCIGRVLWLENKFIQHRLISSNLMSPFDFEEELEFLYQDLCDDYAYDQRIIMYDNAAYTSVGGGDNSFAFDSGDGARYFDAIDENLDWASESCQIGILELDLQTAWEDYLVSSNIQKCSWFQDQSYFESILEWFAAVASIWGVALLSGSFFYEVIHSGKLNFDELKEIIYSDLHKNESQLETVDKMVEQQESNIEPSVD